WTQVELNGGASAVDSQDKAIDYAKKLHANIKQYTKGGTGPLNPVNRGEIAVGIIFAANCLAAKKQGFPVDVSYPAEGTGYEVGGLALVNKSKHTNNAKKYIDWALTKQAQELAFTVLSYEQKPTLPDAKTPSGFPANVTLVKYDIVTAGTAKQKI